jgi:hypothetical protein
MKPTWQEKLALWMMKPRPPKKWNERMSHWWVLALLGLYFSIPCLILGRKVSILIESVLLNGESIEPEFAAYLSEMSAFGFYGLSLGILTFFLCFGLVYEERKGYKRIITKLKSKAEPDVSHNAFGA